MLRCNVQLLSRNQCCSGKAHSVIYSECVFVAVGIHSHTYLYQTGHFRPLPKIFNTNKCSSN
jgi:hypothetical protein